MLARFGNISATTTIMKLIIVSLLASSFWLTAGAKNIAPSASMLINHQVGSRFLSNRALQQDEFADPTRCTTTGNTTFCPDFCGPGRDWSVTQNGTQTFCQRPCGDDPLFDCTGEAFATSRDPLFVCEDVCDWGIAAGGGLIRCFLTSDDLWQCHSIDDTIDLIPFEDEMSINYVCKTLPVFEPNQANCDCVIYLEAGTHYPDVDRVCSGCVILPSDNITDGISDYYYDFSDLMDGTCVGKDQDGCISSPYAPCLQEINEIGLEGVLGQELDFEIEVSSGDTVECETTGLTAGDTDLYLRFAGDEDLDCASIGYSNVETCTSTAVTDGVLQVIVRAHEPFTDVDLACCVRRPPTPAPTSAPTARPSTSIVQEKGSAESPGLIIGIAAAVGVAVVVAGAGLFVFFRGRGQQPKPERGVGGKQAHRSFAPPQSALAAFGDGPHQRTPQQQNPFAHYDPAHYDHDTTLNSEEDCIHHAPRPYFPPTDPSTATEYTAGGNRASSASGAGSGHADAGPYTPSAKDQCRTVSAEAVPFAEVTREMQDTSTK